MLCVLVAKNHAFCNKKNPGSNVRCNSCQVSCWHGSCLCYETLIIFLHVLVQRLPLPVQIASMILAGAMCRIAVLLMMLMQRRLPMNLF